MKKAVVFLADGFEECEGIIPIDLLRRSGVEVITASVMPGRQEIISSHRLPIMADALAAEVDFTHVDMLVFPGGLKGSENLAASHLATEKAKEFAAAGKFVAAICAAPAVVFGSIGLVRGKTATCYPTFQAQLAAAGAEVKDQDVVVDGNLITGRAMGAGIPFAMALITALQGKAIADKVASDICWG